MIRTVEAIHIYSELNEWIEYVVILEDAGQTDEAIRIINNAYNMWFETENEDVAFIPIGEFISSELHKANIEHTIYFAIITSQ